MVHIRFTVRLLFILACLISQSICGDHHKKNKNKYSAEANAASNRFEDDFALETNELPPAPQERLDADLRTLHKPFRMAKLNTVWAKAQQVGSNFGNY